MHWTDFVTSIFLAGGVIFALTGAMGVVRFPDFYSRLHAAGKTDSFAQALFMTGMLFQAWKYEGLVFGASARLVMITMFILLTSPIATHAITKAAHLDGLQPWTKEKPPGA
jgi:multicomponent Na+:H+ antiporter subunit G